MLRHYLATTDGAVVGLTPGATVGALRAPQHPDIVRAWADDTYPGALLIIGPPKSGRTFTAHAAIRHYLDRLNMPGILTVEGRTEASWASGLVNSCRHTSRTIAGASVVVVEDLLSTYTPSSPAAGWLRLRLGEALAGQHGRLVVTMTVHAPLIPHWERQLDTFIDATWGDRIATLLGHRTVIPIH
ncbi:hypothetical protein [Nonomuraea sp. NPDC023979]|uniref:hypothetical protein n=1 Tax=Nonomuraea sp. NPDC023979 TaxID=3154796 RepID=UPI0033D6BC3D